MCRRPRRVRHFRVVSQKRRLIRGKTLWHIHYVIGGILGGGKGHTGMLLHRV